MPGPERSNKWLAAGWCPYGTCHKHEPTFLVAAFKDDQLELTFLVAAFKYDQLGKIKQVPEAYEGTRD